jgi:hypothetical protein
VRDVIDVLATAGADADLAGAAPASLEAMLQNEGVEPDVRRALLGGDALTLRSLLGAPDHVCSIIQPAEEEEDAGGEEEDDGLEDDPGDDEEPGGH